jgi:hypothetical protein
MKSIQTLLFVFLSHFLFSQEPKVEWAKTYGGSLSASANAISINSKNESLIVGYISSNNFDLIESKGRDDVWIIKLNSNGDTIWKKNYGGSRFDRSKTVTATADNNFLVGGYSSSLDKDVLQNNGLTDAWLFKIDNQGNIIWSKTFGGTKNEVINSVFETKNGDIYIGITSDSNDGDFQNGLGNNDWWIFKLDKSGNIIWKKRIGGSNFDELKKLTNIDDKTFVAVGSYFSNDDDFINPKSDFIVKMDTSGRKIWQKSFGSPLDSTWLMNTWNAVSVSEDKKNLILTGDSYNFNNQSQDVSILKMDTSGNLIWYKLYGGGGADVGQKAVFLSNGDILGLANSLSNDGNVSGNNGSIDFWLYRLNENGNFKWQKCFGGTKGENAYDFAFASINKIIVVGYTTSNDGIFNKNNGNLGWAIVQIQYDFNSDIESINPFSSIKIFPNPVDKTLIIQSDVHPIENIIITDLSGRIIKNNKIESSPLNTEIDCAYLLNGAYILTIKTGNSIINRKIFVTR